jgi:excisionase family DNA binding protein
MSRRYLTIPEVAELARREHKLIRAAIHSGRLRAFRPDAGRWLIREDDAVKWIETPQTATVQRRSSPVPRSSDRFAAGIRELERREKALRDA